MKIALLNKLKSVRETLYSNIVAMKTSSKFKEKVNLKNNTNYIKKHRAITMLLNKK